MEYHLYLIFVFFLSYIVNFSLKIYGENILTLNETNWALISNILDEDRPDFMLLNECKLGKANFNIKNCKI